MNFINQTPEYKFGRQKVLSIKVSDSLGSWLGNNEELFPEQLTGATITKIGSVDEEDLCEGGGLVIDFNKGGEEYRIVFGFNELGMWIDGFEKVI